MSVDDETASGGAVDDETASDGGFDDETADEPLIAVRNLSVSYGDTEVVSDVDLTVEPGSFVGLVGPNGAGKSTVLRAIKGTVEPDAGRVELRGDPVSTLSAREAGRRVASVPQDTGLSFEFQVRHVVEMGRTPHLGRFDGHGPEDAAAVDEAMSAARVERFADRSIAAVSGGERQRVLLARALAQETPALLLDEPTASLDVNHAVATADLVRDIVDEGRGALAAIHDLDMAARYCDEVVVLANGGVHVAGPPDEVLSGDTLRTAFDAEAFVGRNPATGSPSVTAFDAVDRVGSVGGNGDGAGEDRDTSTTVVGTVHVVGAGREAARVAARLAAAGYAISAGVVPAGDALAGVVRDADGQVVTAPPFESVDAERRDTARDLVRDADAAVVVGDRSRATPPDLIATPERVVEADTDVPDRELLSAVQEAVEDA